ncbi:hypothetical protein FSP39_017312 [Pinctada imbricata]|uniref:Mediator of RNA polymerase II transcription subunit 13 n=1 Tax=Pinctada imbricata TaxID=66713 RepID=A0AA88XHL5_PINIB|nr:hypothetical protein FSP39_017312 [Pinctada imbricata]
MFTENDNGAWDKEGSGISYECRTLLFKALHNLIERCLLTKGFVRLGRWFVQPHEALNAPVDRGTHLSFCFNFFLHGESSVCASIEIKQHPAVWRLTNQHLTTAQESPGNFPVILVPYGLSGNLTGNSYKESDQSANKILREWLQFYPVEMMDKEGDAHKVPPLVEVLVAGVRMKYPSCYVLLCDMEETTPRGQQTALPPTVPRQSTILHNGPLTPPNSPLDGATLAGDNTLKMGGGHQDVGQPAEINSGLLGRTARVFSARVTEKVSHDNCTTAGIAKRHKSRNKTNVANQDKLKNPALGKVQKGDKPEKVERQQSRFTRGAAPFHRRLGASEDIVQCDSPMLSGTSAPVSSNFGGSVTGTNLPQLNSTEGVATAGESPSPADMSPLDEHQSQNQILDPSMPKLSPHPPADTAGERDTSAINNNKSHNEQQTQSASATGGSSEFIKPCESSTPKGIDGVLSPLESWGQQSEAKTASINSWIKSQQPQQDIQGIKRPALPMHDADQDELVITSLYDFNPVKSWCEFPVKKQRLDYRYSSDVGNDDSSNMNNSGFQNAISSPMYKHSSAPDPYAFPDDGMDDAITPAMVSTRRLRPSHDERQSPHGKMDDPSKDPSKGSNDAFSFREDKTTDLSSLTSPPRSPNTLFGAGFTRERDLMAKVSDLDHMFESDDDNDDTVSTYMYNCTFTSDELIKMYPTPPSNNSSDRSPGTSCHDIPVETTLIDRPVIKTEIFTEDLFKDLPPVYKLPEKADFKGSDKYSPVSLQTRLSPVVVPPDYRGSWQLQYPMGHIPDIMEKPPSSSHYVNIPSIENIPSLPSRMPSSAIESSPATFQNSVSQQRTPMSFELQSPASNASSYLNKTLNSVDNQGTNNQVPEVDSLIVNIYLMDSRLNLFRDHNFDSCNICVCNMNIKGSDVGIYVPESSTSNSDSQIRCVCGFSAIMNRKSAHNAGLFYEDEVEITGIKDDRYEQRKPKLLALDYQKDSDDTSLCDDVTQSVLELILGQFTVPYPSSSTLQHLTRLGMGNATRYVESSEIFDLLQIQDGNDTVYTALDQGRQAMDHCPINKPDDSLKNTCLHKWQFLEGARRIPLNSQDSVQVLKSLQPLLQDAIQNKRVTRLWDKLSGPLTWKEFHQLAGRGHQENSTPQPVPSILVGHDRDWLSVSPYSLKFWDKQFLEPYGKPRDIAYVVLAPDNEHIINAIIVFFKELSTMYELNHMGRHSPVSKKLRDGIMRVGKKLAESVKNDDQLDPWFKQIGNSPIANKLRLYAQVCRAFLAPHLAQLKVDQTVFEPLTNHRPGYKPTEIKPEGNQSDHSSFSMPAPSSTPASQVDDRDAMGDDPLGSHKDGSLLDLEQEENQKSPALMIYLVDPFTYSSDWSPDLDRLTKIGLLRCYQQLVKALPEHMQSNVSLQILPLATILESTEKGSNSNLLKSISFSIFSTCRWNLTHTVVGKNLTGFGPAAAAEVFLRKKEDKSLTTKLYSPPFVLAPIKDKQMILKESTREEKQERSMVLFCAYCLSEDQRWLLAVCTDENGELMETCTINVEIPNRNRRKKASARKIGLQKLWDFLLGVVSITTMPCRLVIGRFGRIGHGEMKGKKDSCIFKFPLLKG